MEEKEKNNHHTNDDCNCSEACKHQECNDSGCSCEKKQKPDECKCHEHNEHHDKRNHEHEHKDKYKKEIKDLEHKVEELEDKIKEQEAKVLSSQAEMINYRRRKDEEVARMLKYANEDMVTELLQTIDNFERAIKMDDDNLDDEVSKFLQGFKMIYCNLVNVLEKYEVKAIDGANKEFDPTYHQAVMTDHVDGVAPGMVIEVLQKGYLLKDKVIRPAMVKVSE